MIKLIQDIKIKLEKDQVLEYINCKRDNELYEEYEEEFHRLEGEVYDKIHPSVIVSFGEIKNDTVTKELSVGTKVVYALLTIGREISEWSTRLFSEGDYVAGMLVDAIADTALFQLEPAMKQVIIEESKIRNLGITKRMEAPVDIPMEVQKMIWEETKAKEYLNIGITEGYMFDPVKSTGIVFVLDSECSKFNVDHNCADCPRYDCKLRKVGPRKITIKNKKQVLELSDNKSILELLIENKIYIDASCGGNGTCGKCKIQIIEGNVPYREQDEKVFTKEELARGMRLACKTYPCSDCTISLQGNEDEGFEVLSNYLAREEVASTRDDSKIRYGIGIDIGTTTIVMQLVNRNDGSVLDTYTTINKQRSFGADVISRIEASNNGKGSVLRDSIVNDVVTGVKALIDGKRENIVSLDGVSADDMKVEQLKAKQLQIEEIVIAGNTTMIHLLMGYSCKTLGVSPFEPVNINIIHTDYSTVFEDDSYRIPVTIFPGISTFVGGDIVAGLLNCQFDQEKKIDILIDLGTNGEMAIGNCDRIIVTSTAAGPAFEGGNIANGVGSIPGAICGVTIEHGAVTVETIGKKPPLGICGTGVLEAICELLQQEEIDETGLLSEEYFDDGFPLATGKHGETIGLTQKDIREIQLAKSAIRAGIEILITKYGVHYDDIGTVYLAGGFGYKVNVKKAVQIGLFSTELEKKIIAIGNSSLSGTIQYLCDDTAEQKLEQLLSKSTEINLGNDKLFQELYMEHIMF